MNVVACIKQIPDPGAPGALDPQTYRLQRRGVDLVLDPGDEHAVEAALQVVEAQGGEVRVVSMGPASAVDAIRKALSMGAARGVLATDARLENADALSTARVLAAAITREPYDLVICGTESTDGSSGAVPGQLAELLHVPLLSFAKRLSLGDGRVTIDRQTDDGYDVVEAPLPAVVTVTGGINEPRYPSLRGIMQSRSKEVLQLDVAELGLDGQVGREAATQVVTAVAQAETRKAGEVIEDKGEGAARIVAFLTQLKVI